MADKIAIFYHCLVFKEHNGRELLDPAVRIINDQMQMLYNVGLINACQEMVVGINGGEESKNIVDLLIPIKAKIVLHGLQCHTENRTLFEIEKWVPNHPGWKVLYIHAKGATHPEGDPLRTNWRNCMMRNLVKNWRHCVRELDQNDLVGCHWMTGDKTPPSQSIFAGNFWWARSDYLASIPSMMVRPRIQESGLDSAESRYESEVWIGNGATFPKVKDLHPEWIDQCHS